MPPPSGCPVVAGTTQTPLRQAKAGGVILWIYLNSKGEITVDGNLGVRINPGKFNLGVTKTDGGELDIVNELNNTGSGRFIEAPFLEGTLNAEISAGLGIDLDFFVPGIRIANASVDIEARPKFTATGTLSFGADQLSGPWGFGGNGCVSAGIGAGAVFSAAVNAGVEIKTKWTEVFSAELRIFGAVANRSRYVITGIAWNLVLRVIL